MFMGKKLIPCVSVAAAVFAAAAAVSAEEPANEKKILNMNQFKEYTPRPGRDLQGVRQERRRRHDRDLSVGHFQNRGS